MTTRAPFICLDPNCTECLYLPPSGQGGAMPKFDEKWAAITRDINDRVGAALQRHIEPMFAEDCQITLVVRTPGHPERTVIVSSENEEDVVRPEILEGTKRLDG